MQNRKTCVKGHSQKDQLSLNAGQKLGEHSAILSTFIKPFVIIPAFFLRKKKGILNFVPKSVRRPSVCVSVRMCVRHVSCICISS